MAFTVQLCAFVILVMTGISAGSQCPPEDDIPSCTCNEVNNQAYMTCTNLQNAAELRDVLSVIKNRKIYSLEVEASYMGDIPDDTFKDICIEELKFTYAKITSIGIKNPPFSGLENCLKRLSIVEGFWDYEKPMEKPLQLAHLKKLVYLQMQNNVIGKLGNDWFGNGPVTLQDLHIETGLVKELGNKAFTNLNNLRSLHFTGNSVTMQRSALPPNPRFLETLDLSVNQIEKLPNDLLTNLPALKKLYLDDNALSFLPKSSWEKILPQLELVSLRGNPLVCDSKMKWIIKNNLHKKIIGDCAGPSFPRGREISSLSEDDLGN